MSAPGAKPRLRQLLRQARQRFGRRAEFERATSETLGDLDRHRAEVDTRLEGIMRELANLRWWLQQTSDRGDETAGRLGSLGPLLEQEEHMVAQVSRLAKLVADDVPLSRRGGLELETFDPGLGVEVVGFRDGGVDANERLYLRFEDFFRGSEQEVRDRQRAYLPLIGGHAPLLDVGCGRGEFLEIMREAGISAQGIDLDPAMVERARSRGLDVEQAEAVAYLEALPPASVGVIFAAQVIEHLSYDDLLRFMRGARAALASGGVLVMETVNPHAPQALKHFWIDPTHRNPLFPEVVLALCRLSGFAQGYIWYPQGTGDPDRDRSEQLDYAVVAEAPPAGQP